MLNVLIVDDEPFIPLGLSKLISWEEEGFSVVATASNGKEAYDYIENNHVDLVITDIQMPVMNGMELLKKTKENYPEVDFVVLSGYSDFDYVQTALRNQCKDYLLKPIQKDALINVLRQINKENQAYREDLVKAKKMEAAYLEHSIKELLSGKEDDAFINEINQKHQNISDSKSLRYIHLCPVDIINLEELDDNEINDRLNNMFEKCKELLGEGADLCVMDYLKDENDYTVGFIVSVEDILDEYKTEKDYYEYLLKEIQPFVESPLILLAGKDVDDIRRIGRSYSSACMLRSFQGFLNDKRVYVYEDEMANTSNEGSILCTESLDKLIDAIATNNKQKISDNVNLFFDEIGGVNFTQSTISINMNYLLFRLIYLAVEQDETINQEEVMRYIGESSFERGIQRGSKIHLLKFANEYSEYLIQLRSNVSRGVLADIEKEIRDNYSQNITLRDLSQKYFINSSYLGQIFRKKYGVSFKDYLCDIRIEKAVHELINTDKKITIIAEEVGYKDLDYFTSKFIEKKGMTPAKFRRSMTKA